MTSVGVGILVAVLLGGLLGGCASVPPEPGRGQIGRVERGGPAIARITLTPEAARRIGIETTQVRVTTAGGLMPYAALIYDTKGETFAYANPEPLVYVRHSVRVKEIRGDHIVFAEGPQAGAEVVTAGASQLLGIELGIGS